MAKNDLVTIARDTALRPALAIGIAVLRQLVFSSSSVGQVITRGRECLGKLPKLPQGSDCKSSVYDFVSSNLALATPTIANTGPPQHETGLSPFGDRVCPGRRMPRTGELLEVSGSVAVEAGVGASIEGAPIRVGPAIEISRPPVVIGFSSLAVTLQWLFREL